MTRNDDERVADAPRTAQGRQERARQPRVGDVDVLSTQELELLEAQSDPLINLVGRQERLRANSKAFDDPRFAEWLTHEARVEHEWQLDPDALNADEINALALRIQARLHGERFGVRVGKGAVLVVQQGPLTPVSQLVDELRGTAHAPALDLAIAAGIGRELWDAPVDSWVEIPKDLPRGRYVALTVSGESMSPLMHTGDTVLVRLGADIAADTVIVALVPDHGYVVKRVSGLARRTIELSSLNPEFAPIRIARDRSTVLGTVVVRWCAHGQ